MPRTRFVPVDNSQIKEVEQAVDTITTQMEAGFDEYLSAEQFSRLIEAVRKLELWMSAKRRNAP